MEDTTNKDDFEARDYQVQIAEMAFEKNTIVYLPTGSGKTFISVLAINNFLQKNSCGSKKFGEGGKRAFFLVNTVALVCQQTNQIRNKTPFDVSGYCGYMGVDFWEKEKWEEEFNKYGILIMTAQIFLNLLLGNIITLKDVAITVFDECHHGVVDHPMRQIMQRFKGVPVHDQPRVLGLTATLINRNLRADKVIEEVRTLETTFLSQIATADANNEQMVKAFSTNPQEFKITFTDHNQQQRVYTIRDRVFQQMTEFIKKIQIDNVNKAEKDIQPIGARQIDDNSKKTNKELKNVISDIEVNMNELGLYGGYVAVLARLIQMQKILHHCESEIGRNVFNVVNTNLVFLRKFFETEMGKKSEYQLIKLYTSDKVQRLLGILRQLKDKDTAIVFVTRRFTAKVMFKIVANAAKSDPKLSHINCDFIVGFNVANPFKDTKENMMQKTYNERVLEKFNSGVLNVIFGSNVVEEGLDISNCNNVIMFDAPKDFRSYVQSKGRARHSTSRYIILTSDPDYDKKYQKFLDVEKVLKGLLCGGNYLLRDQPSQDEVDATLFANIEGLEPFEPYGENGPCITALSAISHVNMYLASLRTDKFTRITPYWFLKTEGSRSKCFLHLPMESKARGLVEGTWQTNKENAKRSVALEACKRLFDLKELDIEHLQPVTEEALTVNCISMLPHWDEDEDFSVGTKRKKRRWTKVWPDWLTGCAPTPGTPVYLHLIEHTTMYSPPEDNNRLVAFHQTLTAPVSYAIVSSKKLPKLASFPLFMSTGELEINIMEGQLHRFSQSELAKITIFHGVIFDQVCHAVNRFLIRDYSNNGNAYLIAPVIVGVDNKLEVDWNVMEQANKPFPDPETRPSEEMRRSLVVNEENYLGRIVTPWYRTVPATKYIVTKVCHDMSENTNFPSDLYNSYKEYFEDKYKIKPLIHQPLLEVRALSSRMNNLKPIALTKALKYKNKNENEELEVLLVPEFCHLYPVPARYWLKALLLPSVLHRMGQLCTAEELRLKLVQDIKIGSEKLPPGKTPKKLEEDVSLAKPKPIEVTQLLTPLGINFRGQGAGSNRSNSEFSGGRDPPNIYHDMDNTTLFDVVFCEEFINQPLYSDMTKSADKNKTEDTTSDSSAPMDADLDLSSSNLVASTSSQISCDLETKKRKTDDVSELPTSKKKLKISKDVGPKYVQPPVLHMLQKSVEGPGPEQVQMMQAITTANANDLIDCERLETLGDSFLKFAISIILFETQQDLSEGVLTSLKGQMVGNRNLYFCGKNRHLGNILEVQEFTPPVHWVPPQFCVEQMVKSVIIDAELDPALLYKMIIPEEDVILGRISKPVRDEIRGIFTSAVDDENKKKEEDKQFKPLPVQTCVFINQLALTDKNISDAVEAILGVYLENSGIFGALRVMNWFGVIDPKLATEGVFTEKLSSPTRSKEGSPEDHLLRPELLEDIIHYKFRDRAYLLQALTHPSFNPNRITPSYQRLEFLGDAILDFLITIYIYEQCKELHPGDLTDLRSALVNNITLGSIAVRYGLQCYLLHRSKPLYELIGRFVKHQEDNNHKIDNDILFLCEEREVRMAESIEVPKALGDLFEALIGAVYLDSGKNLDVTWKVLYNLMRQEIDTFKANVPKNHVRMLYESKCGPEFSSWVENDGVVAVAVEVLHQGQKINTVGFGDNKKEAKRAAAKQALRVIRGVLPQKTPT